MATGRPSNHPSRPADFQRALELYRSGRLAEALPQLRALAEQSPRDPQYSFYAGTAALQLGDAATAAALLEQSLALAANVNGFNNLGLALLDLRQPERALHAFERALALVPEHAEAHYNRASALHSLGRLDDALNGFDEAIRRRPGDARAHNNRAVVLRELGFAERSLAALAQALALDPGNAEAHNNRGTALAQLKRPAEALQSYASALRARPDFAEAHNNMGCARADLGQPDQALPAFDAAIRLKPDYAEAYENRAGTLRALGRLDEALRDLRRALALQRSPGPTLGECMLTQLELCDWSDYAANRRQLDDQIGAGTAVQPFITLLACDSAAIQRRAAELWVHRHWPAGGPAPAAGRSRGGRLRLGYFSPDFRLHATMHLIGEVFERHERSRFEVIGIALGPPSRDLWRQRAADSLDRFVDVGALDDAEAVAAARTLDIDIAIDLGGYTRHARPDLFAARCAPIQAAYLGYPGTSGAPFIDYVIADATVIPPEHRPHYVEKVAYLPNCYQANRRTVEVASSRPTRPDCGLPEGGFVFACFNGVRKITPEVFDAWARILRQVDGSVLWLMEGNRWAGENLRREAQQRGIDPARLVFAPSVPMAEHLARVGLADLFLDTLPYGAHTTASDALRSGVPVLTRSGATFAGRVAASLLRTLGLNELIADSAAEYEALAVALARQPERLAALRRRLLDAVGHAPLYDAERLARDLERLYERMHERLLAGLRPEHLEALDWR